MERETVTVNAEGYRMLVAAAERLIERVDSGRAVVTEHYHQLQSALDMLHTHRVEEQNAQG